MTRGWVLIGRVARPHGVRGGLKIQLENPETKLLRPGIPLRLQNERAGEATLLVERTYGSGLVVLKGIGDRDAAERWRGAEVKARREDFPELTDDEAYLVDLIGARVIHADGRALGVIEGFSDTRVQPLATVRTATGELREMPLVPGIVTAIDEKAGVVEVSPPEGLLEGEAEEVAPGQGAKRASQRRRRRRPTRPREAER